MATLTKQPAKREANDLTWTTSSDDGDDFITTGKEMLLVKNSGVSAITLTVTTPATVDGLAVDDLTVEVGAGDIALVGPFPAHIYGDSDNSVSIDCGADYADVDYALVAAS